MAVKPYFIHAASHFLNLVVQFLGSFALVSITAGLLACSFGLFVKNTHTTPLITFNNND